MMRRELEALRFAWGVGRAGLRPTFETSAVWSRREWRAFQFGYGRAPRGVFYRTHAPGVVVVRRRDLFEPEAARWMLPLWHPDYGLAVLPTSRAWWRAAWWRCLAGPAFRALEWIGAWDVPEGELYVRGRFNWRVWRAGRRGGA